MTNKLTSIQKEEFIKRIPAGKIGSTNDIAYTALFLASDEASFVNGVCLDVNGGWVMT